jgi:hypothetical protein
MLFTEWRCAMYVRKSFLSALAATTLLCSAAFASDQVAKTPANGKAADSDFGKLSTDGAKAIRDVHLARLAIFDGRTTEAKKYIDEANSSLMKAKTDDTAFMKAEDDLKPPAGMAQPRTKTAISGSPIKWLPVDGSVALDEDYIATPEKTAGVAKANAQLKKGDHKQALDTLKLADVDVSFIEEVAPLDKTASGVQKAAQLIASGQYFEANQDLKGVEDGLRFNVDTTAAVPTKSADAIAKTSPMSETPQPTK